MTTEIILAKKYSKLQEDNLLSYTAKLEKKFSFEISNASESGLLYENATFLENLLILNSINVPVFLSFIYQFFSTTHLLPIDKSQESIEEYKKRNQRINCTKRSALYLSGKSI